MFLPWQIVQTLLKSILVCILIISSASAWECNSHIEYGAPGQADQYLCRAGYAAGYSYKYKNPIWVAYHLTAESVAVKLERKDSFKPDSEIPYEFQAKLSDFEKSGYDRGHMAPCAAIDFSQESMEESFLLSNMSPQAPGLNRAGWKVLENYVRHWAEKRGEVYVITGPIFDAKMDQTIGDGVYIPSYFYKVVYDTEMPGDAIAFIVPNTDISSRDLPYYITSVDKVESITGFDFMPLIPDQIEDIIEMETDHLWER